jgi:hypothetical protein
MSSGILNFFSLWTSDNVLTLNVQIRNNQHIYIIINIQWNCPNDKVVQYINLIDHNQNTIEYHSRTNNDNFRHS